MVTSLFSSQGRLFCLLITFANSLFPDEYRQNVGLDLDTARFDTLVVFLKDAFEKVILKKKSADDNESIKLTQRAKSYLKLFTFLRVYLLDKRMPDSKKYINVYTKSKNKDEQTTLKERRNKMKCYWNRANIF